MATMIEIIGSIIGSIFVWAGAISLLGGHSGIGILYGSVIIIIGFIISSYYKS